MQQAVTTRNAPEYVGKYTLYICPHGGLILVAGNQRMLVTPEEARELLDYWIELAGKFSSGNGSSHDTTMG